MSESHPTSSPRSLRFGGESTPRHVISMRWGGCQFDLFAERAMCWRRERTLVIADPHFGKAAAFRAHGVPVPHGTTRANLDRLTELICTTQTKRLIVLGDFLHARGGRAHETMHRIALWRRQHLRVNIIIVRGNHDAHAGDPPSEWGMSCVDEPYIEGNLGFRHTPDAARGLTGIPTDFTFAGHIHPCAVLHGSDGSSMRAACFHFSRDQAILPAFGAFTGAHPIRPMRGDRIFALGDGAIHEVKTACA